MVTIPNPSWPLMATQVAFNAGLNTTATPTWTDLTPRMWSFGCDRGRQYELDQTQAGLGRVVFADKDEYLNPANTAAPAPYAGNVLPYRQIMIQAQWPPGPVGAAVNLLNSVSGYDPSFETTAVGGTPPNMLTFNTSPTVQAANPFVGVNSLQWSVLGNSTQQSVGFTIPTIPGQQYTASCYYRQTGGNTGIIFVNGMAGGTTTTTTGAYVRLTTTFTATQPTHQLFVGSFTPTLASTVNVDAFQLEPGATASTFSLTGPVIYGVHRGYVERWPSKWNYRGMYGYAEITTVDAFAALAARKMHTEYRSMLATKKPDYWWPLGDGSNATVWAEVSGNNGPPLTRIDRTASGGTGTPPTFNSGATTTIAGDPGATGVSINYSGATNGNPVTYLQTGAYGTPLVVLDATPNPSALTIAVWASWSGSFSGGGYFVFLLDSTSTSAFELGFDSGGIFTRTESVSGGVDNMVATSSVNVSAKADGKQHLVIATLTNGAGGTQVKLYIDGSPVATSPLTTPYKFNNPFSQIALGGVAIPSNGTTVPGLPGGVYDHLAIWKRELTVQDVTDLWTAGNAYAGETSGARISRYLTGNYGGATMLDTGQSTMAVSNLTEGTTLLDACQAVTLAENGNFWVDGDGNLTFAARTRRYLATTSQYTFGEAENPYEDDIAYDYDATLVYNDVSVQQAAGTNATASDATSQTNYGPRSYQRQVNVASGLEAIDAANWILNTHKDPHQRIATLTIKPSANPALWPVALGTEIGQRVTVKRRTTAGLTMSADYFIEQISHSQKPDEWTTSFQMSPADQTSVWILGDPTYGQLGITSTLGY